MRQTTEKKKDKTKLTHIYFLYFKCEFIAWPNRFVIQPNSQKIQDNWNVFFFFTLFLEFAPVIFSVKQCSIFMFFSWSWILVKTSTSNTFPCSQCHAYACETENNRESVTDVRSVQCHPCKQMGVQFNINCDTKKKKKNTNKQKEKRQKKQKAEQKNWLLKTKVRNKFSTQEEKKKLFFFYLVCWFFVWRQNKKEKNLCWFWSEQWTDHKQQCSKIQRKIKGIENTYSAQLIEILRRKRKRWENKKKRICSINVSQLFDSHFLFSTYFLLHFFFFSIFSFPFQVWPFFYFVPQFFLISFLLFLLLLLVWEEDVWRL